MSLTVIQFAHRLGVAPSTIYRLEEGKIRLNDRWIHSIRAIAGSKVVS